MGLGFDLQRSTTAFSLRFEVERDVWVVIWVFLFGCGQSEIIAWLWWISTDERWVMLVNLKPSNDMDFFLECSRYNL